VFIVEFILEFCVFHCRVYYVAFKSLLHVYNICKGFIYVYLEVYRVWNC
jgi:hypothetical protein